MNPQAVPFDEAFEEEEEEEEDRDETANNQQLMEVDGLYHLNAI